MDWKTVGKAVSKFAPVLGTVIGGPLGTAAGGAVSLLLSNALGTDPEQLTPELVMDKLTTDPTIRVKLKEIEVAHQTRLQELALETDKIYLADVANARQREMDITRATGKRDINLYLLAWMIVFGFFALVAIMMFVTIPTQSHQSVGILFGGLVAGFTGVIQYFFGSSKSSQDKTNFLAANQK